MRCNEWDADFMKFAASGDSTEEFLEHLGSCNSCLKAVEAEFFLQMLHTERYAEKLLKSKLKKAALP